MGARWAWSAICEDGHMTGNWSGGSDGYCDDYTNWVEWCPICGGTFDHGVGLTLFCENEDYSYVAIPCTKPLVVEIRDDAFEDPTESLLSLYREWLKGSISSDPT